MRVTQLNEIARMEPGTPLDCVSGVVCYVGSYKTGTGKYGPWTIQNIELIDGGTKVKVKVTGHDEIDKRRMNRKLYLIAGTNKKGESAGLQVELDTYKEVTSTIIKVTGTASISESGPGEQAPATMRPLPVRPDAQPEPPPTDPPWPTDVPDHPPVQPPVRTVTPGNPDARKAWAKFDHALNKLRRLRIRTLMAASRIAEDARANGINVDAQHVEKIDSWLAIEACRNGLVIDVPDCDPPAQHQATDGW